MIAIVEELTSCTTSESPRHAESDQQVVRSKKQEQQKPREQTILYNFDAKLENDCRTGLAHVSSVSAIR